VRRSPAEWLRLSRSVSLGREKVVGWRWVGSGKTCVRCGSWVAVTAWQHLHGEREGGADTKDETPS